jgi:toxin ParE1/3/4
MKFTIRAAVRGDLSDIAAYIARDDPEQAIKFAQGLTSRIRDVAARPMTFPARDDWRPGLRAARHGRYYIIFRVDGDRVIVLRILHASRNLPDLV